MTFPPELAWLLALAPRADGEELAPVDPLGADEPALEVRVDHAGALGRPGAGPKRPGARLVFAGREERPPAEEVVRAAGEPGQDALGDAEVGEERLSLVGRRLGDVRGSFDLDAHRQRVG